MCTKIYLSIVLIGKIKKILRKNQNFSWTYSKFIRHAENNIGDGLALTHKLNVETLKLHVEAWAGENNPTLKKQRNLVLAKWIQVRNKKSSLLPKLKVKKLIL